jgi:hypothetical protein
VGLGFDLSGCAGTVCVWRAPGRPWRRAGRSCSIFAKRAAEMGHLQALSPASACTKTASVVITVAFEHGAGEKCQRQDRIKMV